MYHDSDACNTPSFVTVDNQQSVLRRSIFRCLQNLYFLADPLTGCGVRNDDHLAGAAV